MKQYSKCLAIVALVAALSSFLSSHEPTPVVPQFVPRAAAIAIVAKPIETIPEIPIWTVKAPVAGASVERINTALAYYHDMGMTKQGAAYLVGNFIQENGLKTDTCGQDGNAIACGLAQWHEPRRPDMPLGEAQFGWAVNVEMARHSPGLKAALFDPNASASTIIAGIKHWEAYGTMGSRYVYGQIIYDSIK